MKVKEFLSLYEHDPLVQTAVEHIRSRPGMAVQLKGLAGSMDAVVAASIVRALTGFHLFVLNDREEAAYFSQDIETLFEQKDLEHHVFPASAKRPYQFEEVDNANVLQRAETLSALNNHIRLAKDGKAVPTVLVYTYPEALAEKVVNKRYLTENTLTVRVGDKIDTAFLAEVLSGYDFEKNDFVYEPGQYAVRGGIIDVFSFSSELPYRIELFGDEIESIRTFNPETQLSEEHRPALSIVPNVQQRLVQAGRDSFLNFFPDEACLWFRDWNFTIDSIDKAFEKVSGNFAQIVEAAGGTKVIAKPEELFDDADTFKKTLGNRQSIEFGTRMSQRKNVRVEFSAVPQPSFNKNFNLLTKNLADFQARHYSIVLSSESPRQLERLATIFEELDRTVRFQPLYAALRQGFEDKTQKIVCYTDHQIFERYHRAKQRDRFSKSKALTLKELRTLQPGDYVTHIDHGVGRFVGLEKKEINGAAQEVIHIVYRDNDFLSVSVHALHKISKYVGKEGTPPQISKLGSEEWENKKARVKKKVKDIARDLISLYAKRRAAKGMAFSRDGYLQAELESSFMYEDTPDQAKATADTKADMEKPYPMDRLVCGDVGFGKTEVAIRAAFKAAVDGKQVAVLVPTTILAMQHYKTFRDRLQNLPVSVDYINRFKSAAQVKETLKKVAEGKIEILIGTHRIVSKDVVFKDLGLLVVDEEQKFGVKVKDRLKELRVNVDVLTLTATPIPRTLSFSMMGARDLSVIATAPLNRQPVTTEVHVFDEAFIRDAIRKELARGGQVFFVHNRVSDIEEAAHMILRLVPSARIAFAHGQMDGTKLENTMLKFMEGETDVLVSTNIIESGLDIPNANTIIINRAQNFGLSDLHQMRGRVGRSNKKAYCYLLTPPPSVLPADARKRLQTLEEFSDLGEGFKIAMRDLDIRGAGDLLGSEQSGFITDLGFDAYHKILDEAVQELKDSEFKDLFKDQGAGADEVFVRDCVIETDMEILIPDSYVSSVSERIGLYAQLDDLPDEKALDRFATELQDRFGPLPRPVQDLIKTVRIRWVAKQLGFERVNLKEKGMRCYFLPAEREQYFKGAMFGHILAYVQAHPGRCRLKETSKRLILTVATVPNLDSAIELLGDMRGVTVVAEPNL